MRTMLAVAGVLVLASCLHGRKPAPLGATGSWLVAANVGAWFETYGDSGGFGEQILVSTAVAPHLLVGGRVTGLTEFNIGLYGKRDDVAHLVDLGPTIGAATNWSRLAVSASAGPMLTHVKYHAQEWKTSLTLGLGLDLGVTIRVYGPIEIGAGVFENFNRDQSATGYGLRIQGSVY